MRFVFIGGCPRSGTTLVQKILLSHSKITGSREFDFLPALLNVYGEMHRPEQLDKHTFFYNKEQLEKHWTLFIEQLLSANISDTSKYEYFSEKTPLNISVASHLLELFKDSRFIYIYRDGRDVVNSLKQAKGRADGAGEKVQWPKAYWPHMWRERVQQYEMVKNNDHFKNRHIAIRYEDLVNSPKEQIAGIMSFLGLNTEEKQLAPEKFTAPEFESRIDKVWYTREIFEQKISNENVFKWKSGLNVFEKIKYQVIMADYLKRYGYNVSAMYLQLNSGYFGLKALWHKLRSK